MHLEQLALFGIAAANLFIGLRVLVRNPAHPLNRSFFVFALGISIWTVALNLLYITHDFLYDKLAWAGYLLIILGLVPFARLFPSGNALPRGFWKLFLPLALCASVIPFDGLIQAIAIDGEGYVQPVLGPFFPLFILTTIGYMITVGAFLMRSFRASGTKERAQMAYLATGIVIFTGSFLVLDVALPALGIYQLNLGGPVASLVLMLLVAYAIVRHQLMDIRVIIQRGLVYSLLIGTIVGFYIALMQAMRYALGADTEIATFAGAVATTVIGIFSVPHIEQAFRRATDRIFFKDTYAYADAMHALSEVLYANTELDDLVRESEEALARWLRASSVRITLKDAAHALPEDAKALQIPVKLDGEDIGCISLGEKRSGDPYTAEDLQLLRTFAYQAATALSRARLYADAKEDAAKLEAKVRERTEELSDAYARERQMINDISHNLQTPLTVLQTKLEQLKPIVNDDAKIGSLEQSLASFSGFVYELLALARLEGGRKPEHTEIDLSLLLSDLAEEIGIIAAEKGVEVSTDIEAGLRVSGDERQLREALMNVASNALKHLKDVGERAVSFSARAEGGSATIVISDTGRGIGPDDLPHVFERFYRGKDTQKELRGTGLGLPIAKLIMEQHAGTIAIRSEQGRGARVEICLPLA